MHHQPQGPGAGDACGMRGFPPLSGCVPSFPSSTTPRKTFRVSSSTGRGPGSTASVAFDIGVTLRDGDRQYFYSRLDEHYPGLKKYILWICTEMPMVGKPRKKELMAFFKRLCRERQMETDINKLSLSSEIRGQGSGRAAELHGPYIEPACDTGNISGLLFISWIQAVFLYVSLHFTHILQPGQVGTYRTSHQHMLLEGHDQPIVVKDFLKKRF